MDIGNAASLIQQSVNQNNAWSAQQAQKQMDFQERMSNTAHQREIADLKASGLNPVLSAKLGGASTPSGAMGDTDTSGTSALVNLLEMAMETANSAAGAAYAASSSVSDNSAYNLLGFSPILGLDAFKKLSADDALKVQADASKGPVAALGNFVANMLETKHPRNILQRLGNEAGQFIRENLENFANWNSAYLLRNGPTNGSSGYWYKRRYEESKNRTRSTKTSTSGQF